MCIRNVTASVLTVRDKTLTKRLSKENAAAKTLVFLQKIHTSGQGSLRLPFVTILDKAE